MAFEQTFGFTQTEIKKMNDKEKKMVNSYICAVLII